MKLGYKDFIKKAKENYYRIGAVSCPAFNNELVYFNKNGFNHLIRKDRILRPMHQQIKRINLIPHAKKILETNNTFLNYRQSHIDLLSAQFWSIKGNIDGKCIRIVIRKRNNGRLHFFSIMEE